MKKKNKKKGKKTLTAVGAVIAAGLSPGILSATPGMLPPCPSMEFTAADMVSINGEVIDFDELFVTPQVNNDDDDEVMRAQREKAIRESIRRVQKENAKVYGPPPPEHVSDTLPNE